VTNQISLPALVLFAIIFFWTPPHFWSLALRYEDEYRAANVPMLPVARGDAETRRQILLYAILLVPVTLLLLPFQVVGAIYLVAALGLGASFVWQSARLWRDPAHYSPMRLFAFSISYLALLFAAMVVDQLVQNAVHLRFL
jgi:protoheme IX farnesyltransferase